MKNNYIKKILNWFSWLLYKLKTFSFAKYILFFYLFITIIGSLFLYLPISQNKNQNIKYIDALFTSASAFSDTGLTTITTASSWSHFGQGIIAMLILFGGIGWFSLKVYFFNILLGRPISFKSNEIVVAERGTIQVHETRRIIKVSITILFFILFIFSIILTIYFYFSKPLEQPFENVNSTNMLYENPYQNISISVRWGMFHTISALNNAGFDIMGSNSLQPFYQNYGLQIVFMILFITGGIGYPVIFDIYLWIKSKFTKENFKWSLFSKISMLTYVLVSLIGLAVVFTIEVSQLEIDNKTSFWSDSKYGTKNQKTMALIFNTFSTRNAGFSTIEMKSLSSTTLIIYSIMMFIGSAPSSTAGGIRTITFALVLLSLWSKIRGRNSVRAFNKRIPQNTVNKSFVVTTVSFVLIIIASIILTSSFKEYGGNLNNASNLTKYDQNVDYYSYVDLFFEVSSAFGTTGLSTGITSSISLFSKLSLILLMFIGQLGVSSSLLIWDKKNNNQRKFEFVEEDITTG